MMPSSYRRLLPLLFVLAAVQGARAQSAALPFKWWVNEQFSKDLVLSVDQTTRIDTIFQSTMPQLRTQKNELDRLEDKLSRLIETGSDEGQVVRYVDKVEAMRASLNKMRTLMLLHMRQVLSPEQRVRLKALHDRWQQEQRQPPPDPRKPKED